MAKHLEEYKPNDNTMPLEESARRVGRGLEVFDFIFTLRIYS